LEISEGLIRFQLNFPQFCPIFCHLSILHCCCIFVEKGERIVGEKDGQKGIGGGNSFEWIWLFCTGGGMKYLEPVGHFGTWQLVRLAGHSVHK
jgi:hypothetical protein